MLSHQLFLHEIVNTVPKQQISDGRITRSGTFKCQSVCASAFSQARTCNPPPICCWKCLVLLIWTVLEVGGRKQACSVFFLIEHHINISDFWSCFIYHSSHPHPMVMATTFWGWKGTVSSHVHRFHRANVYLYTEIWRDAHGMCLQWVCGCIWNVYSFKCIVGFSLCVFYARNVTSVCVFFFLPMGWMDSSLAKCLSACTCVCVQVCMCLLFLNVSHMWSLLEALTHFLSLLLMSASLTQQNHVSKHICDGSFHTIHPRINHLLRDAKCSLCC